VAIDSNSSTPNSMINMSPGKPAAMSRMDISTSVVPNSPAKSIAIIPALIPVKIAITSMIARPASSIPVMVFSL